jgi:replication factor C large subunit
MEPWTIKYEPKKISEIKGQDEAVRQIKNFLENYKKQKRKALLLIGPTGTGKTSAVHAFAKEHNYELLEVNASDTRNQDKIDSIIGENSKQQSLFFRPKLILVDEIDGITGQEDRGGATALAKLIETTSFPIIMTANDASDSKFSPLRKQAVSVEFKKVEYSDIFAMLKEISKKEKIECEEDALKLLARKNNGDVRGAINDLQSLSQKKEKITKQMVQETGERKQTETIAEAMIKIMKTTDVNIAKDAFNNVDDDLDECMLWIDESLPKEYEKPSDLVRAYDKLSKADVFNGRIKRWQHWRFLVYYSALMTAGVASAKDEKYKKTIEYERTKRILKLWMAKQSYAKRKTIAEKIAKKTHKSIKSTIKDTLPYLRIAFNKNKEMRDKMISEFELEQEEVEWMRK